MLSNQQIDQVLSLAFNEDVPFGDLTSQVLLPPQATVEATLIARVPGVLSGSGVFQRALKWLDTEVTVDSALDDGDRFSVGETLATVAGPAAAVLTAERIALNLIQHMSGIATLTAAYVCAVEHTHARIVDTRKTTPGLRALERHAVRNGGGHNHRFCLSDAVMAKDNHLALLPATSGSLSSALRRARRQLPHTTHIEVEVDRLSQIQEALDGGADTIMLDNFEVDELRQGVELINGRAWVEASGGVTLDTVAEIAATGVDIISVGALTQAAAALDLGLDIKVSDIQASQ